VDLTTIDDAAPAPPAHRLRRRQVAGVVVVVLCALLALWGTPSRASEASFGQALRAGDVSGWQLDSPQSEYGLQIQAGFTVSVGSSQSPRSTVLWGDSHGRLYRTSLDNLLRVADPSAPAGLDAGDLVASGGDVDPGATIDATARAAGVPVPSTPVGARAYACWPLVAVSLAAVVLLLLAPQPRRRTKWGTFWTLGVPAGIGLLWWILTDSPWSARTDAMPAPAPRQRGPLPGGVVRAGGGQMLLIAFALGMAVSFVLLVVHLVPILADRTEPPTGSVTWSVVWTSGSQGSLNE